MGRRNAEVGGSGLSPVLTRWGSTCGVGCETCSPIRSPDGRSGATREKSESAHRDRRGRRRGQAHVDHGLRAAFEAAGQVGGQPGLPALRPLGARRRGRRGAARRTRRPRRRRCMRWRCCSRWTAPAPATRSSELSAAHDVVILDRYVASNAAYSAARLHQGVDGEVVAWVRGWSSNASAYPPPTGRCCSRCPPNSPGSGPQRRAEAEADRARDAYERDDGLQRRTSEAYAALAAARLGWTVAGGRTGRRRGRSRHCTLAP